MNTNQLLDAAKTRLGLSSDYALSAKLDISRQGVREMRERGLSDVRAVQIAHILELDPAQVLAWVHAERAQDPAVRKVWEKLAKSLAAALALVALWGIAAPRRAGATIVSQAIHYAKYLKSLFVGLLRRCSRRWVAALALLLCVSRAAIAAPPFSRADWAWQAAATASLAVDWAQSRDSARHPALFETNLIMGRHPSASTVNAYFIASAVLDAGIARLLPPPWRRAWQVGTVGVEIVAIRRNALLGVHIHF